MKTEELQLHHERWLQDPVTRQILILIDKHRENIIKTLSSQSLTESPTRLQLFAVQLNTTDQIKSIIYDTTTFVSKIGAK